MRIGRPGLIGARVGGEARRRQSSRGGVLPELAKLSPLGWDSSGKRAREAQCGTRNPPGVTAGLAGARSSGHSCGGGLAGKRVRVQFWARELGKRACARVQCKGDAKPGQNGAVQCRRGMAACGAAAAKRRCSRSGCRGGYGIPESA